MNANANANIMELKLLLNEPRIVTVDEFRKLANVQVVSSAATIADITNTLTEFTWLYPDAESVCHRPSQ